MKQVESKGDQGVSETGLRFAESLSQNPVNEFRCSEITLGLKHLYWMLLTVHLSGAQSNTKVRFSTNIQPFLGL